MVLQRLVCLSLLRRLGYRSMSTCVAEVVVFPIGTGSPSVSKYVTECQKILEQSNVKHQLTPMGTVIEGTIDEVFATVKKLHEAPFSDKEVQRVYTILHLDDRRDKHLTMEGKIKAVEDQLRK
mmetsp:Transcript_16342/g.26989  ORF Transcript_16342/g.26989 Transcript_16342/m.26989 type:complete len:123 (+) Transcript_16342:116-484(+)